HIAGVLVDPHFRPGREDEGQGDRDVLRVFQPFAGAGDIVVVARETRLEIAGLAGDVGEGPHRLDDAEFIIVDHQGRGDGLQLLDDRRVVIDAADDQVRLQRGDGLDVQRVEATDIFYLGIGKVDAQRIHAAAQEWIAGGIGAAGGAHDRRAQLVKRQGDDLVVERNDPLR